jgi:hypothetical protein
MRLREGYVEAGARGAARLDALLAASYPVFAQVLRGALRLTGRPVPAAPLEAVHGFCAAAGLDPAPFDAVAALRDGARPDDLEDLFARYYAALERAADFVDRYVVAVASTTPQGATP